MKKLEAILTTLLATGTTTVAQQPDISDYMRNVYTLRAVALYYDMQTKGSSLADPRFRLPLWHGTATAYRQTEDLTYLFSNYHLVDEDRMDQVRRGLERQGKPFDLRFLKYEYYLVDSMADEDPSDDILVTTVGSDQGNDMVYFKTGEPLEIFPVELGSSSAIKAGQNTYLIGMHLSIAKLLTQGIVSGDSPFDDGHFLIDNKSNPGSSGGPIFQIQDGQLKVIGVYHQYTSVGERMACIIPIDDIREGLEKAIQ